MTRVAMCQIIFIGMIREVYLLQPKWISFSRDTLVQKGISARNISISRKGIETVDVNFRSYEGIHTKR